MKTASSKNPYHILIPTPFEASFLMDEASISNLLNPAAPINTICYPQYAFRYGIVGFGLAAAGSGASRSLTNKLYFEVETAPAILIGIAGTYQPEKYPVGSVVCASSVECVGIGVGSGAEYQSAGEMGWAQGIPFKGAPEVSDIIEAVRPKTLTLPTGKFLSVTSASSNLEEARLRASEFPDAAGEEMEGFSVGLACRNLNRPFAMIRGISNIAGDRDKAHWKIKEALSAVNKALFQMIEDFLEEA